MSNISKEIMDRIIAEANNQYNDEVIESTHDFIKGATYQLATDGREQDKTDFQIAWELSQTKDKPFFIDIVRALIRSYDDEEISLSKLVEELNIMSVKWHENADGREELENKLEYLTIEKLGYDELKKEDDEKDKQIEELKAENERLKEIIAELEIELFNSPGHGEINP